ncbi:MAG: DUF1028 domain-containing protein, partial [Acidobacteria bacterium]|nr:DUF1028 domain-containing protein [Acidobacteriota bacterium]
MKRELIAIAFAVACAAALASRAGEAQGGARKFERANDEASSSETVRPLRPVHTFSIVARDPVTGELGVAVQSHWFSVGSSVPWAEAGV